MLCFQNEQPPLFPKALLFYVLTHLFGKPKTGLKERNYFAHFSYIKKDTLDTAVFIVELWDLSITTEVSKVFLLTLSGFGSGLLNS